MGIPNIQQQLYLKTALNESKDGMFEHPTDLDEGYHKKSMRLIRAGDFERAAEQGDRAEASGLMRGGASKRTMKAHFNKKDYAAGTKAQQRFDKAAAKKRDAALKAKGIAEALEEKLDEGYQAKRMRIIRKYGRKQLGSGSLLSPKLDDFMKRSFKKKRQREERISGGKGAVKAMEVSARKKTAAMKAKGLMEGSRGTKRLARIIKSVTKNYRQGKAIIGTRNRDVADRELIYPNSPEAVASRTRLHAGVAHMQKKTALRRQISSRTRAAAMRERGRAGLNPKLPYNASMTSANTTGGYEHTEYPKRVPSAIKNYRKASAVKRNMYR